MTFDPVRLHDLRCRILWQHSDAEALGVVAERYPAILPPDEWATVREHVEFVHHGPERYREFAQRKDAQTELSDVQVEENWEALTAAPRWAMVTGYLRKWVRGQDPLRMLDLGTWTGAHAVAMSNQFPMATVFAREIVAGCRSAIERTIRAHAVQPERVVYEQGDHWAPPLPGDLVAAYSGEVMEHVPNVAEFVGAIERACRDGAWVTFTTPTQEPDDHPTRVHVRNLESADLRELFGRKKNSRCYRTLSGHHVFGWTVDGAPTGAVDWDRKLASWGIP